MGSPSQQSRGCCLIITCSSSVLKLRRIAIVRALCKVSRSVSSAILFCRPIFESHCNKRGLRLDGKLPSTQRSPCGILHTLRRREGIPRSDLGQYRWSSIGTMTIPAWMKLWYRKPQWKDVNEYTRELNEERRNPSPERQLQKQTSRTSVSIPRRLALDRVLDNKTCSPLSLHDFYMYLRYIEHSSENLEFYLW